MADIQLTHQHFSVIRTAMKATRRVIGLPEFDKPGLPTLTWKDCRITYAGSMNPRIGIRTVRVRGSIWVYDPTDKKSDSRILRIRATHESDGSPAPDGRICFGQKSIDITVRDSIKDGLIRKNFMLDMIGMIICEH